MTIKIFNKWDTTVTVNDPGLKNYINLKPSLVPRTFGRQAKQQFHKSQMNIVERLMTHIFVSGHKGKRHRITSGKNIGKTSMAYGLVRDCFNIIEERTKKNPVEVLVRAIENAALREEITSFQVGGITIRRAVITAPQRRVDLALRQMVQGSHKKSLKNPKGFAQCLAEEIIAAYNYDSQNSHVIKEKERIEREAGGAR